MPPCIVTLVCVRSTPDSRRLDVTTLGTVPDVLPRTNVSRCALAGTMHRRSGRLMRELSGTGSARSSVVLPQAAG